MTHAHFPEDTMTWMRTSSIYLDQLDQRVWSNISHAFDDGGIGVTEWLNIETGTRMLLFAEGSWKTGGHFHLWWVDTQDRVVELDGQLSNPYFTVDPSRWQDVKDSLIQSVEITLQPVNLG